MNKIEKLKELIAASGSIAFLGGAGVSTESGIPDFRSENGRFEAVRRFGESPETLLSHTFFLHKPEVFFDYYRQALLVRDARPNNAHLALAKLEKMGKLTAVITQNIDSLHQAAGSKNVLELHGSTARNYCMKCRRSFGQDYVESAKGVPLCPCGGIVKPDVVLYEEGLDEDVLSRAVTHISKADMLIVGGTSLAVYPAAGLVNYYRGRRLVLINRSSTPYDSMADLIINESIGEVLKLAVGVE